MLPSQKTSSRGAWIYPLLTVVVLVVGIASTVYIAFLIHNSNKQRLIANVNTLAQVLQYEDFKSLRASDEDLENSAYVHIKNILVSVRSVNSDIRFIYLNGLRQDGMMFFYADSEDPESEDYSPPGQEYPEATPDMFTVFEKKTNGFEASSDRWGYWFSAYAPVLDRSGNVIALVGMDVPGRDYIINIIVYASLPLFLAIIILVLLLASQKIRRREEHYIRQREEFLAIASHEIRTPLTGIRWETEKVLTDVTQPLADYLRHSYGLIHSSCVELVERINNLLSLSQMENMKNKDIDKEKVDVKELVTTVIGVLSLSAEIKGITLVPDSSIVPNTYIYGNLEYIRQVLTNIVSNAVKYTNKNTEVSISYKQKNEGHEISVTDHGDGIGFEDMEKIFEGYRTEKARKSDNAGNGFGLYMSRKMARKQGGDITVVSEVGKGSTFTLVLP